MKTVWVPALTEYNVGLFYINDLCFILYSCTHLPSLLQYWHQNFPTVNNVRSWTFVGWVDTWMQPVIVELRGSQTLRVTNLKFEMHPFRGELKKIKIDNEGLPIDSRNS